MLQKPKDTGSYIKEQIDLFCFKHITDSFCYFYVTGEMHINPRAMPLVIFSCSLSVLCLALNKVKKCIQIRLEMMHVMRDSTLSLSYALQHYYCDVFVHCISHFLLKSVLLSVVNMSER
jgi:hypothetical protein